MSFVVKLALYTNYISYAQTKSIMVLSGIESNLFDGILLSKQIYFHWISIFFNTTKYQFGTNSEEVEAEVAEGGKVR